MTSITVRATEDIGIGKKEAERAKNMFALGLLSWMYGRPAETTLELARAEVRRQAGDLRRERRGVQGRIQLRRDHRAVRALVPGQGRAGRARHLPQHRGVHGAVVGIGRGQPSGAGCRCSTRAIRSRRPPSCCTSSRRHKNFGVITLQAEDEIAAANMALGAAFAGHLGRDRDERAGHGPQGRDARARRDHGAAR